MVMAAMRSDAVAMANAFSMPSADSRIGISQMGRVTRRSLRDRINSSHNVRHLRSGFDFRNQNEIGRLRNNLFQVGQSERKLIDSHHALGRAEIHGPQRIANQQPRRIFLGIVHRIFQVENDRVRPMQSGVDEVLGLVAGKIEPRAPQTIARRRRRQRHRLW